MATIATPQIDTQFQVGPDSFIYVAFEPEVEDDGRTLVIGHDDMGEEVHVRFYSAEYYEQEQGA